MSDSVAQGSAGTPSEVPNSATDTPAQVQDAPYVPHFKSLEEADRAARRFQGEKDQLAAQNAEIARKVAHWEQKLGKFVAQTGGIDGLADLAEEVVEIARRPDWNAYRDGTLGPTSDGEFLSDEQKEIRQLARSQADQAKNSARTDQRINAELAQLKFDRLEPQMQKRWGDLWNLQKPKVIATISRLSDLGMANPLDAITEKFLTDAFANSFDTPDQYADAMRKWAANADAQHRDAVNGVATTGVSSVGRAADARPVPKTLSEAFQRAVETTRARQVA